MRVRTRNRIVMGAHLTILLFLEGCFFYIAYQADPRYSIRLAIAVAINCGAILIGTTLYLRALKRATKQILDDAGLTRADLPKIEEKPIPIIPPLAKNKEELFGGIFVLVLILVIFILSWSGMFKKWFRE